MKEAAPFLLLTSTFPDDASVSVMAFPTLDDTAVALGGHVDSAEVHPLQPAVSPPQPQRAASSPEFALAHHGKPKRKRASRACLSCRARKVRCNVAEGIPCANCRMDEVACVVTTSRRRRYAGRTVCLVMTVVITLSSPWRTGVAEHIPSPSPTNSPKCHCATLLAPMPKKLLILVTSAL